MHEHNQFIVIEWRDTLPGFPRYTFATINHAKELSPHVRWVEACASLEMSAEIADRLNAPDASSESEPGQP